MHKIRVLVADKNDMFSHSLKTLLQRHTDVEITPAGTSLEALYASVQSKPFEVLLLDEAMLNPDAQTVKQKLSELKAAFRLVILSNSELRAGTLPKNASIDELLNAIRRA